MSLAHLRVRTKIMIIVGLMGLLLVGVATTGVQSLAHLASVSDAMRLAGDQAVLGARMNQNVLSLSRAEFRVAALPDAANIAEVRSIVARHRQEFESRRQQAATEADPRQAEILKAVDKAYAAYAVELSDTLARAEQGAASVTAEQRALSDAAMDGREAAKTLQAAVNAYVDLTDEKNARYEQDSADTYHRMRLIAMVTTVCGLVLGVAVGLLIARRGIVAPLTEAIGALERLAAGHLDTPIAGTRRRDEIGAIARTMQTFKDAMAAARQAETMAKYNEDRLREERRQAMLSLADSFEQSVSGVVESVSGAATQMQATANSMSGNAEQTRTQALSVAAASDQASANVQTVAAATEQLTCSIAAIAGQVGAAAQASRDAAAEAERTNRHMRGLADSATRIGEVVGLINTIASQTNMLALNATIEAARAGDSGKGFAVVAGEVKALAHQTAKATEEIAGQVAAVQQSTDEAVQAIARIARAVAGVDATATEIAGAVEQQSAAAREIARNVQQAAGGTRDVSDNIRDVRHAADDTGIAASQVLAAANDLSRQSGDLRRQVTAFVQRVRAA